MQMGVECQPDMISLTAATKHGAWMQCPSDSAQSHTATSAQDAVTLPPFNGEGVSQSFPSINDP
jgi:hypothetical protein